ncbi:hypothetical protein T261_00355 [Streptomyces lydicus]|nr:hypothetical protein T261_00355 [Streptomyces lydicus]
MPGANRYLTVPRVEGQLALEDIEVLVMPIVNVRPGANDSGGQTELLEGKVSARVLAGEPEEVRNTGDVYQLTVLGATQQWTGGNLGLIIGHGGILAQALPDGQESRRRVSNDIQRSPGRSAGSPRFTNAPSWQLS